MIFPWCGFFCFVLFLRKKIDSLSDLEKVIPPFWAPNLDQTCYWWKREKNPIIPIELTWIWHFVSNCRLEKTIDLLLRGCMEIYQSIKLILYMSGFCSTFNKTVNEQILRCAYWSYIHTDTDFCRNYLTNVKPSPGLFNSICPYTPLHYGKHNIILRYLMNEKFK